MKRFICWVVPALTVSSGVIFGVVILCSRRPNIGLSVVGSLIGGIILLVTIAFFKSLFEVSDLKKMRQTGVTHVWPNWTEFEGESGLSIFDRINNTQHSICFVGISLEHTAHEFYQALRDALKRGVKVQLILLDPDSKYAEAHDEHAWRAFRTMTRESLAVFKQLQDRLPSEAKKRLLVLKSKYLTRLSIKIFDERLMLVNLYLYDSPAQRNPVFEVHNTGGYIYTVIKRSITKMAEKADVVCGLEQE